MTLRDRNVGLDVLRIVAMFMIVTLHILSHGGLLNELIVGTTNYIVAWILEIMAYCGVNCYALISGYVGINARYKYSNIIYLWLQVVFYNLVTTFFSLQNSQSMFWREIVKSFTTILDGRYWYFTAYFAMFFVIPFLNYTVKGLMRKQLEWLILILIVLFSCIPVLAGRDVFGTDNGYNVFWLIILYIIGAFVRKYRYIISGKGRRYLWLYFGCILITGSSKFGLEYISGKFSIDLNSGILINYTSPTILFAAVGLLLFFSKVSIPQILSRFFFNISTLTFGVYLLHENPLIRQKFISGKFSKLAELPAFSMFFVIAITVIVIFALGCCMDFVRLKIFHVFKIRKICEKIEEDLRERYNCLN